MKYLLIIFLLVQITLSHAQPFKRKALLMANAAYQINSNFQTLKNPLNDIALIKKRLISLGFEVKELKNIRSRADWEEEISQYAKGIDKETLLILYYAGHGVKELKDGQWQDFLLPVGPVFQTKTDITSSGMTLDWLLDTLSDYHPRVLFSLIDACREKFVTPKNRFYRNQQGQFRGMAQRQLARGVQLQLFSTQSGSVADDGTQHNSPFALAFDQGLSQDGKNLYEVINFVMNKVPEIALPSPEGNSQKPQLMQFGPVPEICLTSGCNITPPTPPHLHTITDQTLGMDMEMIWLPPTGEQGFMMGSAETEEGRYRNEPQHKVVLTKGFYLGKYEVTLAQWRAVMEQDIDVLNAFNPSFVAHFN